MSAINDTFLNSPALNAPNGESHDFDNPPNLDNLTWVVFALTVALSTLSMVLRLIMKLYFLREREIEDYLAAIGWALTIVFTAIAILMVKAGAGIHQWDLRFWQYSQMLYYFQIACILYCLATMFIKLSIAVQYLRIFVPPGQRNAMYWCCWIIIVTHVLVYVPASFFWAFMCTPQRKFYEVWLEGSCRDTGATNVFGGIFNCVTLIAMIVLPLVTLTQLNISLKQKIRLSSIFLIGIFALIASIARTYYSIRLNQNSDQSYNIQLMTLWIAAEFATTIVCSCLPSFPILFRQSWARLKKTVFRVVPSLRKRSPSQSVTIHLETASGNKAMHEHTRPRMNTMHTNFSEVGYPGTVLIRGGRRRSDFSMESAEPVDGGILVIRDFIIEEVTSTYVSRQTV